MSFKGGLDLNWRWKICLLCCETVWWLNYKRVSGDTLANKKKEKLWLPCQVQFPQMCFSLTMQLEEACQTMWAIFCTGVSKGVS